MHIADLHCDTLYKSVCNCKLLDDVQMENKPSTDDNTHKLQCYAIWIPDNMDSDDAERLVYQAYTKLKNECTRLNIHLISHSEKYNRHIDRFVNSSYFTIENGKALNGKLENVKKYAEMGVKIITLTWNDKNNIGEGAKASTFNGITDFGKRVIFEMERYGIIADISHASDKLFYDVAELSSKPFIATHSNSRSITKHPRNLTDDQVKIIINKGGIIGLNFHNEFLNNNPDKSGITDIIRHTEHFLSLGADNNLCLGSDFDGGSLPSDIKGSNSFMDIYEMFLRLNYKESIINKIFYENTDKFFENFDNQRIM